MTGDQCESPSWMLNTYEPEDILKIRRDVFWRERLVQMLLT